MAALNHGCPWRGPLVDASHAGFGEGNRMAAIYLYAASSDAGLEEEEVIIHPPPVGPTGEYDDWRSRKDKKTPLPPQQRRKRQRRRTPYRAPAPEPIRQPTPEEIEAEKQAKVDFQERIERLAREISSTRAELADHAARARAEEEAEILMMAM